MFFIRKNIIKLLAFDDVKGRGRLLLKAARRLGVPSRMFKAASEVQDDEAAYVYLHLLDKSIPLRERLALIDELSQKKWISLIPKPHELVQFHSKILQTRLYADWMPATNIVYSKEESLRLLDAMRYPFISKSDSSSASADVRLIANRAEAISEVDSVFSEQGMQISTGSRQKGYVYWQEFIPGNDFDWRVAVIAKKYAVIGKRFNREGTPFASGSPSNHPFTRLTKEAVDILDFAFGFCLKNNRFMAALDILRNTSGKPILLEVHSMWGWIRSNAMFFENTGDGWKPTKFRSKNMYDLIAKAIVDGDFNEREG